MTNEDILRRLRYTFSYSDAKMKAIYELGNTEKREEKMVDWMRGEDDPQFLECEDIDLATFLNGLIVEKRGVKEGADPARPEKKLNNNVIFMKIKIALSLKGEDVIDILGLADFSLSNHELSAFFRKKGHKHYRDCQDQVLRKFLKGVQLKFAPSKS